jgi:REP element-mobilizing transposase RayT
VAGPDGAGVLHNQPGTPCASDHPGLREYMKERCKQEPIALQRHHADVLLEQFIETARYRHWLLLAVAIMYNHVHIVVGVPGDPEPETLLRDFKSYGSRALNRRWGKPASGTWWTESGSRRKLPNQAAVDETVQYVTQRQPDPLLVFKGEREA